MFSACLFTYSAIASRKRYSMLNNELFLVRLRLLTEDHIPGSCLSDRLPSSLKIDESKFWLQCRDDLYKGLKTKAQLIRRYVLR